MCPRIVLLVVLVVLLPVLVPLAQASPKTTPAMKETGEPEGDAFHFQPIPVDQRVYQMNDPMLSNLARKIEDGSANLIERRGWWWLEQRLEPFDKPIPSGWQVKAQERIKTMEANERLQAIAAGSPEAAIFSWTQIGTGAYLNGSDANAGRATAMWVDPANSSSILLGTADGGIWKTTDKGSTWTPIFDSMASISVGSIGVDPNNTQIIYVGTGEGNNNGDMIGGIGMYKSTNGGTTWSLLTLPAWTYGSPWHNIRKVLVDPNNSNNVYAAVDGGLLYSTNAGSTWTLTTCGASGTCIGSDLVLDPYTSPTTVFAAFGYFGGSAANGVYRATAGAGPWTKISSGTGFPTSNVGRISLVIGTGNATNALSLYALIQSMSTYGSLGIFYTNNDGASSVVWTAESTTNYCSSQAWYDMVGAVDPANPAHIMVGGLDDYMSASNAASIAKVSSWYGSGTGYSHADHHYFYMPDSSHVYDANDGGFFIGTLNWSGPSASWVNKNTGIYTLQYYGMAQHPTDSTKVTGGLQDNGQAYYNGSSWTQVAGGDGGKSAWDQDYAHSNDKYAYEEYVYGAIARNSNFLNSPSSWSCIQNFGGVSGCSGSNPDGSTAFIAPFVLDANNQDVMYTGSKYLYVNSDVRNTSSWAKPSATDLTGGVSGNHVSAIHSARNSGGGSGTGYIGTSNGKAWYFSGGGAALTDISSGLSGATVTSFVTDPANGLKVLVTLSGFGASHVYRSLTGSTAGTWTDITGALPAVPFNTIVLDPNDVTHAYAGSDYGVYENTSVWTGTAWTSIQGNLPSVSVQELGFNVVNHRLRAATHGRGIWEFLRTTTSPQEISPAHNMTAVKGSGTTVNVTYTVNCGDVDTTVYTGSLATLQSGGISWTNRYCSNGATGTLVFDPGNNNVYFVVVGNNGIATEGSYGKNSSNAERPAAGAGSPCAYTQNLTGTCP